jgi:hypothetical protein
MMLERMTASAQSVMDEAIGLGLMESSGVSVRAKASGLVLLGKENLGDLCGEELQASSGSEGCLEVCPACGDPYDECTCS